MAFKKKQDDKKFVFKYKSGVTVRKSYYTFSKQYPAGKIGKIKFKSKSRYKVKHKWLKRSLAVIGLVLVFTLSYFVSTLAYDFSYKSLDLISTTESLDVGEDAVSFLEENEIKAFYLSTDKIADTDYIKDLIKEIKSKNANSVIIDFKTSSGNLIYNSSNSYSLAANAAIYDSQTIREVIDLFENDDIEVIASIYCFEDDLMASYSSDLAVKYMNTTVNWLDDLSENGGRAWLNPYSETVQEYLKDIISEICEFDISGIILQSAQFPDGAAIDNATYIGESSLETRNEVLLEFISDVNEQVTNDKFVLVSQSVTSMLGGEQSIYYGTLNEADVDGFVYDTSEREEIYVIDSTSNYSDFKSMLIQIDAINGGVYSVPMYQEDEYSWWFFKSLSDDGYDSYVIYY
ncbi:MAG: putative glycoside hydrolase [Clostridia bacterium]